MTTAEWEIQWKRLDQFRIPADVKRGDVSAEWFAQLKHHHVDAVDAGITELIGAAKDTFLPGLGLLKEFIHLRLSRYDRTPGKCADCNGTGWIESAPFQSNGLVYSNVVVRCRSCGIPAPKVEHGRRAPLTDLQAHEYAAGRFGRDQMPDGMRIKSSPEAAEKHKSEMRAMLSKLKAKLFGHANITEVPFTEEDVANQLRPVDETLEEVEK